MRRHILAILGYIVATFATQATSHFAVFARHYAAVPHIKPDPIFPLGLLSMIIQGAVLSAIYANLKLSDGTIWSGVRFAWAFGAFLVSYMAFAEAAHYSVPSVSAWIGVELLVGFFQFTLIGVLLALAHRTK
ncbi:MAG: hypothetical protein AB1749_06695 [Pseudomonadota bacterium]